MLDRKFPGFGTWVGFENVFDEMERASKAAVKQLTYPPFNIRKLDKDHYVIELAAAGFGKTDIEVTTKENLLTIKGEMKTDPNSEYLHKGIAERSFERNFNLHDTLVVKNASMINGMLRIFLENFVPPEKQPKKVQINDATSDDLKNC